MPSGPVIINNTPLVALWSIGRLSLLRDLYGEVLIPQAVYDEFLATERAVRQRALDDAPWLRLTKLKNPQKVLVYVGLEQGEAEVLALAEERSARLVIMDERRGRRYAKRLSYPLTGTLGVLLAAKAKGFISAVFPLVEQLLQEGLYLHPEIVEEVLKLAGET
jgi:predicted nucleic acid-binding protein